jgi:hypothetical protein
MAPEPAPVPLEPAPNPPEKPEPAAPAPTDPPMPKPKPEPKPAPAKPVVKPEKPAPEKEQSQLQRVSFLGTVAEGRRFFFIADNSGSMAGVKMTMLKNELAATLKSLNADSQFYVTFFNTEVIPLPAKGWQKGQKDVPKALQWIAAMGVGGGTNPQPAFDMAFNVKPRPDVIFFMTDGQIPATVPLRVRKLNEADPKIVIHTIMMDVRPPAAMLQGGGMLQDQMLKQIASDSGGTYREVIVPMAANPLRLPVRPPIGPPVRRVP